VQPCAFEAIGDERQACAHWTSLARLRPRADDALYDMLRCRARIFDERQAALSEARAIDAPGKRVGSSRSSRRASRRRSKNHRGRQRLR
jgi:hypothetical protein